MKVPKYSELRKDFPWLPESRYVRAIRGLQSNGDGSAVLTLSLELPYIEPTEVKFQEVIDYLRMVFSDPEGPDQEEWKNLRTEALALAEEADTRSKK